MPDRAPNDQPTSASKVTFEVEMTRVETVTMNLPDGVSLEVLSSKRLHSWPDSVLDAIEGTVSEQLLDFHGWELAQHITEISHAGGSATQ